MRTYALSVDNGGGATNLSVGAAQLRGTVYNGLSSTAYLGWGPVDGGTSRSWVNTNTVFAVSDGAAFTNAVSNLLYGVPYYYCCWASNAYGSASAPASASFLGARPTNAAAIFLTNAPATSVTATSAVLNASFACSGSVYKVTAFWNTVNGLTNASQWTNSASLGWYTNLATLTPLSYTATGLPPNATNFFTFQATNSVEALWATNVLSFQTPVGTPTLSNLPPTNVTTTSVTMSGNLAVTFGWTTVSVLYGPTDGGMGPVWAKTNTFAPGQWVQGDTPATNVIGLTPNSDYYYTYQGVDPIGAGYATNSQYFITGPLTVQAADSSFGVTTNDTATVIVSRPASCTGSALTVYYTTSGDATNGVNYTATPTNGSLQFAAGATTATLTLTALQPWNYSAPRTATVTLTPGAYPLGSPASTNITLQTFAFSTLIVSCSTNAFTERWQNDGGIGSTVTITVTNDAFTGANGDEFIGLKALATNVPPGLTASISRLNATQVVAALNGNAVSHTPADGIANLGFTFLNTAFTSGITVATASNLSVVYAQNASNWYVSVSGSDTNDGMSAGTPFLTLGKAVSVARASANDLINMGAGTYTVVDQALNKNLTIQGAGKTQTILQAAAAPFTAANHRILSTTANLILRQMTLQNGNVSGTGGALNSGINGYVDWAFDSCRFLKNVATNSGANGGGAIYLFRNGISSGAGWQAMNCDFIGNRSDNGGAVFSYGLSASFSNCLFTGNQATLDGGAVWYTPGSPCGYINCLLLTNAAGRNGGAVYDGDAGPVSLSSCTLANNSAGTGGGAVYMNKTTMPTVFVATNATFYGNSAGLGGAFYGQNSWGPVGAFYNCTFANNSAQTGGAFRLENSSTAVGLYSCLVAGNSATVAGPDLSYGDGTGNAGFNPVWYSLIAHNSGALPSVYLATRTNAVGAVITNAYFNYVGSNSVPVVGASNVSALADWGGSLPTCKPLAGNPAIDHGSNAVSLVYDQRGAGFPRVSGAQCDMGAYETGSGPARFTYSANAFNEAPANDGSIDNSAPLMIGLDEGIDAFTGVNGDDFVALNKLSVANLPPGLTAVATRQSGTNLSVTLTGKATANDAVSSIANLTFTFQSAALASGAVTNTFNYSVANLQVLFNDNAGPMLTYGGSVFSESSANDGSIGNTISITLSNDTLTGVNGDDFVAAGKVTVSHAPAGLTAVLTRQTPKTLTAALTGNAGAHNTANSVANLTFAFQNSAFAGGNATVVTNSTLSNLQVQYLNPALTYGGKTFSESWMNDGSIANTISASLAGDTFSGAVGEDLVAGGKVTPVNLPAGLTAVVTRQSGTAVSIALTGNAVNHASFQNVSNLGFTFGDAAFAGGQAAIVTNYNESDLAVTWLTQDSSNVYVSASGVDTNAYTGSLAQPFRTVKYALTRVQSVGYDTIHLLPGTYTESNLTASVNVTITGNTRDDTILQPWPAPFAAPNLQILNVAANNLTLKNLTLRHANSYASGAAIACGNGASIITVDGCRLTLNASTNGNGGAISWMNNGGGAGQLNVRNTEISYNQAAAGGGGIWDNMVALSISNCVFLGNNGNTNGNNAGGAVYMTAPYALAIGSSTFTSNSAANAGGVCANGNGGATIYNSSFAWNIATNSGGAFTDNQNASTFVNCTFYGNAAANGGALNVFNNSSGRLNLYNTTVFSNSASVAGGGIYEYQVSFLYSTIVAGNTAPLGPDLIHVGTAIPVDSYSLIGNNTNSYMPAGLTNANGSTIGTPTNAINPRLSPVANKGGLTLVCELQVGSPAINHGTNILGLATDQRGLGYPRVTGAQCDIGAVEFATPGTSFLFY